MFSDMIYLGMRGHTVVSAQSIDHISDLIMQVEENFPTSMHNSVLASVHWPRIYDVYRARSSKESKYNRTLATTKAHATLPFAYTSLGTQIAFSSSNFYRILSTSEPIGDVLTKETLGASSMFLLRLKQWAIPLDFGLHILGFDLNAKQNARWGAISSLAMHNVGADVRYTLLNDSTSILPALSVGLLYNYSYFQFSYVLDGVEFVGIDKADSNVFIKINDITLTMRSHLHSIAGRVELQKSWSFFTATIGLEPSVYISYLSTQTDSKVQISEDSGGSYRDYTNFSEIAQNFLLAKGLEYEKSNVHTLMRLYIGSILSFGTIDVNMQLGIENVSWATTFSTGLTMMW